MTTARPIPTTSQTGPCCVRSPMAYPTAPSSTTAPRRRRIDFRRLDEICSYTDLRLREVHVHRTPDRILDVEELARREPEQPGDEVRREGLDQRVQPHHLVVVELAGEGDLRFRARELLLEGQEVLVRLEVGVVLRHRQQLPEASRDLVLRLRLIPHLGGRDASGPG